jgi:CRISPR-associated protein Csd1
MILQALVELAENEKLIADPDFEFKPVAWVVRLDAQGNVLAIEDYRINLNEGQTDRKGKPIKAKWVGRDTLIPLFPTGRAGTKPKAAFLVDMAKFVFGIEPLEETRDAALLAYVERFRQLVIDCETDTNDPAVSAVRKMLDRVLKGEAVATLPADAGPSDLFAFRVGEDAEFVHQRPSVVVHWKQIRAAPPTEDGDASRTTCLVTGVPIVGAPPLFPLIKGVPGAGTMGSGLLPFNGPSAVTWSSFGLDGNANAPVSRLAAEAAAKALNRLADPRPTNGVGEKLPVRRIKLSPDTVVVFWSPEPAPAAQGVLDLIPDLMGEPRFDAPRDPAEVGNLLAAYRTGTFAPIAEPAKFYAMTLTGTTGRIIVRDWFEIQTRIKAYFDDLRLVRSAGPGRVMELDDSALPSLRDVKLATYRELDDVPAPFGREWLRVVWGTRNVPEGVVAKVIHRIQVALAHGDEPARHAFSILKLFVLREGERHMKAFVNEEHPNVSYHVGRLLAALDFAQQRALGDTNTSNVRRMLGAIMTAPALYLGKIRHLTEVAYLPKMTGNWPDFIGDRIRRISASIGDEIPRILPMREQSTFFLGFDQERTFLQTHPPSHYKWQTSISLWVQSRGEKEIVEALAFLGKRFLYEPGLATDGDRERLPDFRCRRRATRTASSSSTSA